MNDQNNPPKLEAVPPGFVTITDAQGDKFHIRPEYITAYTTKRTTFRVFFADTSATFTYPTEHMARDAETKFEIAFDTWARS